MLTTANLSIDILTLVFTSVGILTSLFILVLILVYRLQCPFTTTTLLICNNYIGVIFCCVILQDMYAHNLYGHLYSNVFFDNWYCYVRAYLISVALSSMYNSYLLQACFRLFRVVFYTHKKLQTYFIVSVLILIQWLFSFLVFLPALYFHYFDYLTPEYYYCQASYTNLRAIMYTAAMVYYFPMCSIGLIYFYVIYYMKKVKNSTVQHNRQKSNERDLVVLRRIIILIGVLFMITCPGLIFYLWYIFTGYLYLLIYQFQWLSFSFGLATLSVTTAIITPQLRGLLKLFFRLNHRIYPVLPTQHIELQQANSTVPITINKQSIQ